MTRLRWRRARRWAARPESWEGPTLALVMIVTIAAVAAILTGEYP